MKLLRKLYVFLFLLMALLTGTSLYSQNDTTILGYQKSMSYARFRPGADTSAAWKMYEQGRCYEIGADGVEKNQRKAFLCYESAAAAGNTQAKYSLGQCYLKMIGTPRDINKGLCLIASAADSNNVDALAFMGERYYYGELFPIDYDSAFYFFNKAAGYKHCKSLYMVAVCRLNGFGTTVDTNMAMYDLMGASDLGDAEADYMLSRLYFSQSNDSLGLVYLKKASNKGMIKAGIEYTQRILYKFNNIYKGVIPKKKNQDVKDSESEKKRKK